MKITSLPEAELRAKVCDRASVSKRVGAPRTRSIDSIRPIGTLAQSGVYTTVSVNYVGTFPAARSIVTFSRGFRLVSVISAMETSTSDVSKSTMLMCWRLQYAAVRMDVTVPDQLTGGSVVATLSRRELSCCGIGGGSKVLGCSGRLVRWVRIVPLSSGTGQGGRLRERSSQATEPVVLEAGSINGAAGARCTVCADGP
jgi:hypothetical protein